MSPNFRSVSCLDDFNSIKKKLHFQSDGNCNRNAVAKNMHFLCQLIAQNLIVLSVKNISEPLTQGTILYDVFLCFELFCVVSEIRLRFSEKILL